MALRVLSWGEGKKRIKPLILYYKPDGSRLYGIIHLIFTRYRIISFKILCYFNDIESDFLEVEYMGFSKAESEELLVKTGRLCCICKKLHDVEIHHIKPVKDGGSDDIENAIPLCPNCHDEVHKGYSPGRRTRSYTEKELKKHRNATMESVNNIKTGKLILDDIEKTYISYIKEWEKLAELDDWRNWSSHVLYDELPQMHYDKRIKLDSLSSWLLSRRWPGKYQTMELAFQNFQGILSDLKQKFSQHAFIREDDILVTKQFYHIQKWDPPLYNKLLLEYTFHVQIVQDLFLELTRAANYICQLAQESLLPTFRMKAGYLTVISGPYSFMDYKEFLLLYSDEEKTHLPYKNLKSFLEIRKTRDICMGVGSSPKDPEFIKSMKS